MRRGLAFFVEDQVVLLEFGADVLEGFIHGVCEFEAVVILLVDHAHADEVRATGATPHWDAAPGPRLSRQTTGLVLPPYSCSSLSIDRA